MIGLFVFRVGGDGRWDTLYERLTASEVLRNGIECEGKRAGVRE